MMDGVWPMRSKNKKPRLGDRGRAWEIRRKQLLDWLHDESVSGGFRNSQARSGEVVGAVTSRGADWFLGDGTASHPASINAQAASAFGIAEST